MPEIFSAMTWSHDQVLGADRSEAYCPGSRFRLLEPWFDIDKVEDVEALAAPSATGNSPGRHEKNAAFRASSLGF
jgi:glycosyltransferase A (GT-A) superfamily protein (DUF2064 family)